MAGLKYLSAQERIDSQENPATAIPGGFAGSIGNLVNEYFPSPGLNEEPVSLKRQSLAEAWQQVPQPTAADFAMAEQARYTPRAATGNSAPDQSAGGSVGPRGGGLSFATAHQPGANLIGMTGSATGPTAALQDTDTSGTAPVTVAPTPRKRSAGGVSATPANKGLTAPQGVNVGAAPDDGFDRPTYRSQDGAQIMEIGGPQEKEKPLTYQDIEKMDPKQQWDTLQRLNALAAMKPFVVTPQERSALKGMTPHEQAWFYHGKIAQQYPHLSPSGVANVFHNVFGDLGSTVANNKALEGLRSAQAGSYTTAADRMAEHKALLGAKKAEQMEKSAQGLIRGYGGNEYDPANAPDANQYIQNRQAYDQSYRQGFNSTINSLPEPNDRKIAIAQWARDFRSKPQDEQQKLLSDTKGTDRRYYDTLRKAGAAQGFDIWSMPPKRPNFAPRTSPNPIIEPE